VRPARRRLARLLRPAGDGSDAGRLTATAGATFGVCGLPVLRAGCDAANPKPIRRRGSRGGAAPSESAAAAAAEAARANHRAGGSCVDHAPGRGRADVHRGCSFGRTTAATVGWSARRPHCGPRRDRAANAYAARVHRGARRRACERSYPEERNVPGPGLVPRGPFGVRLLRCRCSVHGEPPCRTGGCASVLHVREPNDAPAP
jgi:hypothetical protein